MTLKILFLAGPCGREVWMWKIYQEMIKKEDIIPHFIALRKKDVDFFLSKGINSDQITEIFPLENKGLPNMDFLSKCEEKYNLRIWDLWNITLARDKKRAKLSKIEVLGYFQNAFSGIEKIINDFKPNYYLYYGVAGYSTALFNEVLRKNEVTVLELSAAIIPNRFSFLEDLSNVWASLIHYYHLYRKEGIPKEKKEQAENFVKLFRSNPKNPDCAKKFREPFKEKINRLFVYAWQIIKYREIPSNLRFIFWPIIQKFYNFINIFEKPVKNEKFIYFPLHFQPEATTLIYGKWYVDQVNLIEKIAQSIPLTHTLYVKEHPFGYGNRNLSFYKRIKRIPNVRLIGPYENNFDLIKNCSLLTTITGTSGWEALLLGKPVITFGNVFFNVCEETVKVTNIMELPEIIEENLDRKVNEQDVINLVSAVFSCSYKGLARLPSDCNNHSLEKDNIKLLVDGIQDYINSHTSNAKG